MASKGHICRLQCYPLPQGQDTHPKDVSQAQQGLGKGKWLDILILRVTLGQCHEEAHILTQETHGSSGF